MAKLSDGISAVLGAMGASGGDTSRLAARIANVRRKWACAIGSVFGEGAIKEFILVHTNEVGIVTETARDGHPHKKLYVYVDDSMASSELNARRELIRLKFGMELNEDLEVVEILAARGARRKKHPYRASEKPAYIDDVEPVPFSPHERGLVDARVSQVEKARVRQTLKQAMTADMQWKKAINEKKVIEG